MGFTTLSFLSLFLPVCLLMALVLRGKRGYRLFLLAVSFAFFAWASWQQALVLSGFILINYAISLLPEKPRKFMALAFNVGAIALVKFMPLAPSLGAYAWLLPLGFTYAALQALGYHLDGEKGNLLDFAFYLAFLPKALMGPLADYKTLTSQSPKREDRLDDLMQGLGRMIMGLAKKLLLADRLALVTLAASGASIADRGLALSMLAALVFPLQLYLDFSGFTDIALGFARCLGYALPENFARPFHADSLRAFWRRWHMSLSGWFGKHVYRPLGGSRVGSGRAALNTLAVFVLIALWHGLGWGFALWGLWNALVITLERKDVLKPHRLPVWARRLYVYLAAMVGFVFFTAGNQVIPVLSGFFKVGNLRLALMQLTPAFLVSCILGALVVVLEGWEGPGKLPSGIRYSFHIILLILCMLAAAGMSHLPFIYAAF